MQLLFCTDGKYISNILDDIFPTLLILHLNNKLNLGEVRFYEIIKLFILHLMMDFK